jgi:hypothetical protein
MVIPSLPDILYILLPLKAREISKRVENPADGGKLLTPGIGNGVPGSHE